MANLEMRLVILIKENYFMKYGDYGVVSGLGMSVIPLSIRIAYTALVYLILFFVTIVPSGSEWALS